MVEGCWRCVLDKANGSVSKIIKVNKSAQRYYNDYNKKVCGVRGRSMIRERIVFSGRKRFKKYHQAMGGKEPVRYCMYRMGCFGDL